MDFSVQRVRRLLWRAIRLRCPNCGGGPIFRSWLKMRAQCPVCGIELERGEDGYQVGSYMFNIVAAELLFLAVFLVLLFLTWPAPPWTLLQYGGLVLMIVAPFVFFPFSKTLFLAVDLLFRPASGTDGS